MTSSRDYGHMEDIIQFGNEVRQIAELGREVYLGDAFLARRAMERCLQNIGEAAAHLNGHVRSGYPDIPWSDIVGLRNVLAKARDTSRNSKPGGSESVASSGAHGGGTGSISPYEGPSGN